LQPGHVAQPFPLVQSVHFSAYQLLVSEYFLDQAVLELTLTGPESREFCEYALRFIVSHD
jgi:hypothetical protein